MRIASNLFDSRINAKNVLVEMTVKDYEELVKDVLSKNEFQRKRVRSSKTVYALLKEDLLKQCVIPPLVLAFTNDVHVTEGEEVNFENDLRNNKDHLVILDGLQRTYTLFDLLSDLRTKSDEQNLQKVESTILRVEMYVGLNRLGILYRMLTLNTGQTPMSLRQQIEMLYLDYLTHEIDGIELIRESEGRISNRLNQYNFKDIVEGFNSYLDRDALPFDKADLLENISSLEKLSKENQSTELFDKYIISLNRFIERVSELCSDVELEENYTTSAGAPFGSTALKVFKKPQAISGFGAAIGKLIDFSIVTNIDDIISLIAEISLTDAQLFLEEINNSLLWLKNNSKKIGNAQRTFFTFFFRDLFNRDSDGFKNLQECAKTALRKYQSQNM